VRKGAIGNAAVLAGADSRLSDHEPIYRLEAQYDDGHPNEPDDAWWREVVLKASCSYCVGAQVKGDAFDVELEEVPEAVTSFVCGCVCLFRADLVRALGARLRGHVRGKCYLVRDGRRRLIREHVTYYAPVSRQLVIRGGPPTKYRTCKRCAQIDRTTWHAPYYTLKRYLDRRSVYQDSEGRLYITRSLLESVDWSPWEDAVFEAIPVLSNPLDNRTLPVDQS
jgi:hypothetical protein